MMGITSETLIVAFLVSFGFLLIAEFVKEESKNHTGITKGFISTIGTSLDISSTVLLVLSFFVLIAITIDVFSGGTGKTIGQSPLFEINSSSTLVEVK
jgi:uncharacterized membrane protein YidH (DUF202 family)